MTVLKNTLDVPNYSDLITPAVEAHHGIINHDQAAIGLGAALGAGFAIGVEDFFLYLEELFGRELRALPYLSR